MSASKPSSESSWVDPDDAPEWTTEMFDRAEIRIGDKVIRRGRPPGSAKTPAGDRPTPAPRSASTRTSSPPSERKAPAGNRA